MSYFTNKYDRERGDLVFSYFSPFSRLKLTKIEI
jgi:hypothetical protein